jgi:hypothetical protein
MRYRSSCNFDLNNGRILLANSSNPHFCVGVSHDKSESSDHFGQFANSMRTVLERGFWTLKTVIIQGEMRPKIGSSINNPKYITAGAFATSSSRRALNSRGSRRDMPGL